MEIQQKPDYLIFAEGSKSGELSDFPDISRGWGITLEQTQAKPPLEWMNSAFNRIDKNTLYLLQQGVPEWSESVLYPIGAIIKVDGILYESKTQNTNLNPINSTNDWQLVVRFQDATTKQKGIVQLNSATNSSSEAEAATPKAVKTAYDLAKKANDKDYEFNGGTVTGDTNFTGKLQQAGSDVITSANISSYQSELGVNQTWKNVTSERTQGIKYTNTTKKPIIIIISGNNTDNKRTEFYIDDVLVGRMGTGTSTLTMVVPVNSTYYIDSSKLSYLNWSELS